jgi:predicted nucleic acid-binding protein
MTTPIVVDTCGWIEVAIQGPLAGQFLPVLRHLEHVIVPTVVQYELYRWFCREQDVERAMRAISLTDMTRVVLLDRDVALLAADLAAHYRLAMADAIIYATAQTLQATLITCDAHFQGLPGVTYLDRD